MVRCYDPRMSPGIGDSNNEHLRMDRGRYPARAYLLAAVVTQAFGLWAACLLLWSRFGPRGEENTGMLLALIAALLGTTATFWNRWRVIEAFASRYTTGFANLSLATATLAAWGYANVRLGARLIRQEHRLAAPSRLVNRPSGR